MRVRRLIVTKLLEYLASSEANRASMTEAFPALHDADERELDWLMRAGLGPLLYRATGKGATAPARWRGKLFAADLNAQLLSRKRIETATEIIDECLARGIPVTLLKGISVSEAYYPAPHLRPMLDVDLLVPADAYGDLENALLRRGFMHGAEMLDTSKHGTPLHHPKLKVCVELHTALFEGHIPLRSGRSFGAEQVAAERVESSFHGRRVYRLSDALQLAYTACGWVRDQRTTTRPRFLLQPILDMVCVVATRGEAIDWEKLVDAMEGQAARLSTFLGLGYLAHLCPGAVPSRVLQRLAAQSAVGQREAKVVNAILDAQVLRGPLNLRIIALDTMLGHGSFVGKLLRVPWNLVFPPGEPGRYSARFHIDRVRFHLDRVARMLRQSS